MRYLLILISVFCIQFPSQGQVSLGAKGGGNVSWLSTSIEDVSQAPLLGVHGGVSAQFGLPFLHHRLSVQPDVMYSRQGSSFNFSESGHDGFAAYNVDGRAVMRTDFFNLMVPFKLTMGLERIGYYFLAGPYAGYWSSGRMDVEATGNYGAFPINVTQDASYEFEDEDQRLDIGVTVGVGYRMTVGPGDFLVEVRYNHGFVNNISTAIPPVGQYFQGVDFGENSANRVIMLSLGYLVHLGR
ncbi:porin family protein [Cytophagaceae bacterium ABcell3]|nr:porin family protein [Cytophagaceae bacterium ABcell3]